MDNKAQIEKKLNSKKGMRILLSQDKIDIDKALRQLAYQKKLEGQQLEMLRLQEDVVANKRRVIVLFEGRDAAGKGGAIRRVTEHLNPRHLKIVALPKPTKDMEDDWYFSRYVAQFPKQGEIVFFDRSWYNRAVVEPVMGFCKDEEYDIFMDQVNDFERMITTSGIELVKIYMSISKREQAKRFEDIKKDPLKQWKFSRVDAVAQALWDRYTHYRKLMLKNTNESVPWKVIKADSKSTARLEVLRYLLKQLPYDKQISI